MAFDPVQPPFTPLPNQSSLSQSEDQVPFTSAFTAVSYIIFEKFDSDYLVWVQQVNPVLRAHKLHRLSVLPQILA